MKDERWIWITSWEKFQHYQPSRERGPAWIKDYTAQMNDERYLSLTDRQRALLRDLRDVFATNRGQLSDDTRTITRYRHSQTRHADIVALNHAGFIEFLSRESLEQRLELFYSRSDTEKDKEKDLGGKGRGKQPAPRTPASLEVVTTNQEHPVGKLREVLEWIGDHADQHTAHVVATKWVQAPEHVQVQVMDATFTASPRNRAAYVVQILSGSPSALKEIV